MIWPWVGFAIPGLPGANIERFYQMSEDDKQVLAGVFILLFFTACIVIVWGDYGYTPETRAAKERAYSLSSKATLGTRPESNPRVFSFDDDLPSERW